MRRIDARQERPEAALAELRRALSPQGNVVSPAGQRKTIEVFGEPLAPRAVVERICEDVQREGLPAVLRYTEALDQRTLTAEQVRVPVEDMRASHAAADAEFLEVVRQVRANIMEFQTALLPKDALVRRPGVELRQRFSPLRRVGVCVPGGAAAYPSTVLMTVTPAQAAGVEQIAVVAPPTAYGADNPDIQAACWELGVRELYRVGGAQAVAALAFGVASPSLSIEPVDKIVGPGNMFVALAKKHVYGHVDIDSIAGPSEVIVLADESTPPEFAASDLLAQAEHAPGASILITWNEATGDAVLEAVARQLRTLPRAEAARISLKEFGALILTRDVQQALELAEWFAPEHLHLAFEGAEAWAARSRSAGAVFVGTYSPVAVGDYAAGPSHVLPTSGTARWASGLSSLDFLRRSSVIHYNREALAAIAPAVRLLADREGLTAHRASVDLRLQDP